MPSFSPMGRYNLTVTQVDLILYALKNIELTPEEDNERRKIVEEFYTYRLDPQTYNPEEDPYANYCDI